MDNQTNNGATLMAHCGTQKITREELRELPLPKATDTHQPLSHFELVEALIETLSYRYLKVRRDEYAVSRDGMKMFGVMDLEYGFTGCSYSIGLRNSNDKSMRLALTAGYRVFVCDNMMFSGDFEPLLHKHTKNLNLRDSLSVAIDRIHRNFEPLKEKVKKWKEIGLKDEFVKLVLYEAFLDRKLKVPRSLLPVIHDYYFKPDHETFTQRNLWSLSNAFTSSFKRLKPVQQFAATGKLGGFLERVAERAEDARILDFQLVRMMGTQKPNGQNKPDSNLSDSGFEDLTTEFDEDEIRGAFDEYDGGIEDEVYAEYEDDLDYEKELDNEYMRKAA